MVYRVEGLSRVHTEDNKVFVYWPIGVLNQAVEEFVQLLKVFFKHPPRGKPLLRGVEVSVKGESKSGVTTAPATMRLSAFVTEMGRVSEGRRVPFLGMRKRRPKL